VSVCPAYWGSVGFRPPRAERRDASRSYNCHMAESVTVTTEEWDTWRAFHARRKRLDFAIERALHEVSGISEPDYEILITLFESPEKQLRSRELGTATGWEKSRLSHQLTRLERRGLVRRVDCDTDGRGTWIQLTPDGSRAILGAIREHADSIRRLFFDVITDEEKAVFKDVSERVLEAIDPPDCASEDEEVA
jgi:DNA-binding MarR family transcriptional regulator